MKYAVFALTLLASIPAAVVCGMSRRALAVLVGCMFVVILKFDATALNFISYEFYRGTSRGMEVSLAYIVAFAVLLALKTRGFRLKFLPDAGAWLFLAYFAWAVVSAFANDNSMVVDLALVEGRTVFDFPLHGRMLSFFELWKMVMLFLTFCAVYNYLELARDERAVVRSLAIVVLVCFCMVIKEHFSHVYQVRGPFPHQNSMALFMMLLAPVFFAAYLNLPKSGFRMLCTAAFVCASGALLRTYSRGAIACYPLAAALTAYQSLFRKFKARTVTRLLPLVLCGMAGFLVMLPRIVERFESAPQSSGDTRKRLALTAANIIRERTWTGVGVNNWSLYVNAHPECLGGDEYRPSGSSDTSAGIVETIYLLVGAECGLPGLLILVLWFCYYWVLALMLCHRLVGTRWFYLPAGLLGGLTGCYLESALEWVLKQQLNFLMLMVSFAVLSWLNRNWRSLKADGGEAVLT